MFLRPCRGGAREGPFTTGCAHEARALPVATTLGPAGARVIAGDLDPPQFGRSAARVGALFVVGGPEGVFDDIAGEAGFDEVGEGVLDGAVFERVKTDDADAGTGGEPLCARAGVGAAWWLQGACPGGDFIEERVEVAEFIVDGDAEGLEGACGRVDAPGRFAGEC